MAADGPIRRTPSNPVADRPGSADPTWVHGIAIHPAAGGGIYLDVPGESTFLGDAERQLLIRALGGVPADDLLPLLEVDGVQTYSIKAPR